MGYILNRAAMRVVQKNERGNVTYRKRYTRGDEVDVSKMEDEVVEKHLATGVLVDSEKDLDESVDAGDISPVSPPFGAETSAVTEDPADVVDVPEEEGTNTESEENPDEVEDVDAYSDMDYASLQQEAKKRDLNGGGSAEDLRARLRADDAS